MAGEINKEVGRLKELVEKEAVVSASEITPADVGEILAQFDDDTAEGEYAHYLVKVKREQKPRIITSPQPIPSTVAEKLEEPQVSLSDLVNETLELSDQISQKRTEPRKEDEYSPEFLLENAQILEKSGETTLARNIYLELVRKGLNIPSGLVGVARTYETESNYVQAERYYREGLAYSSEPGIYRSLVAVLIVQGKDEDAARYLIHALGLPELGDEQKFEFHKSLGNCYARLSEFDRAAHQYGKAYEINPRSDNLQVNVGSLALQKGDLKSAKEHFLKALELNTRNEKAINGLGMVYLAQNEIQKAHDHFLASLEIDVQNIGAIYNLVKCAYELKSFNAAAQMLERYMEANPTSAGNTNILYSYCGILYHQGHYNMALKEADKILNLNPQHAGAREIKALIGANQGR